MTVALLGFDSADFIDDIEMGGAATFFEFAGKADICLFIQFMARSRRDLTTAFLSIQACCKI
jgi:hypothetical protein